MRDQISKCVARRCSILGLDAPTKVSPTSPDGEQSYHSHVMAELMKLAEQSQQSPVVVDADYITSIVEQQRIEHHEPGNGTAEGNGHDE